MISPTTAQIVAANVRAARQQRGLTLAQLTERSGIAKGTIITVESGRANPTIETLSCLADALALPLTDIVTPAGDDLPTIRRAGVVEAPLDQQRVARWAHSAANELWNLRLQAGHGVDRAAHANGTVEIILVHSGSLRCGPTGELTVLAAGDTITFRADCDHSYRAGPDCDVDATVVMLMPWAAGSHTLR